MGVTAKAVSSKKLERLFRKMDKDKDGKLNFDEFLSLVSTESTPSRSLEGPVDNRRESSIQVFKGFAAAFDEHHGRRAKAAQSIALHSGGVATPLRSGAGRLPIGQSKERCINSDCLNLLMWRCYRDLKNLHQPESKARSKGHKPALPDTQLTRQVRTKIIQSADLHGGVDWLQRFEKRDCYKTGHIDFMDFHEVIRKEAYVTVDMVSASVLEELFKRLGADASGFIKYSNILEWLEAEKSEVVHGQHGDIQRQYLDWLEAGQRSSPLKAPQASTSTRAEAAARVRASLKALLDFSKSLADRTAECKQQAAAAHQRSEVAITAAKQTAQAICNRTEDHRVVTNRLELLEKNLSEQTLDDLAEERAGAGKDLEPADFDEFPIF